MPSANLSTLGNIFDPSSDSIFMPVIMMSEVTLLVTLKRIIAQAELKCDVWATTLLASTDFKMVLVYT